MGESTPPICEWPTYRCAPAITWVKDTDQTLLVDSKRGLSWSIRGTEAATWDYLTLAYPYDKIARFLSLLMSASTDEAERTLVTTLRIWQRAGIIQAVEGTEGDKPGDQCRL